MAVPVRSTFGGHLQTLMKVILSNWSVNLSLSQFNGMIAHIQQQIVTDSATVIADCTNDLAVWVEPPQTRHT